MWRSAEKALEETDLRVVSGLVTRSLAEQVPLTTKYASVFHARVMRA